jgi:predicted  nucleic acid-binding Zn-ribbon protein
MTHNCLRCQHTWKSTVEFPSRCPACGSHTFDLPAGGNDVRSYTEQRLSCSCGHTWIQKGETGPNKCPNNNCQRSRVSRVLEAQVTKYADRG